MTQRDELVARAEELGLTVTRADGKDGDPVVEDYERAIAEYEASDALGKPAALADAGEERTYEVGGAFKVFGRRRGQTVTGKVVQHEESGDELFEVDGEWAVLQPLLDAGHLKPTT